MKATCEVEQAGVAELELQPEREDL